MPGDKRLSTPAKKDSPFITQHVMGKLRGASESKIEKCFSFKLLSQNLGTGTVELMGITDKGQNSKMTTGNGRN